MKKFVTTLIAALLVLASLTACTTGTAEEQARDKQQAQSIQGDSLEKKNLGEKRKREENPTAVGYVYLMSFGKVLGYYVIKGKVSSNGSQAAPEEDIVWTCRHGDCLPVVVDSAQDDGSYGTGDPGIFFFTAEGVKVVTDLDYVHSDQPIPFDVPKLNKG